MKTRYKQADRENEENEGRHKNKNYSRTWDKMVIWLLDFKQIEELLSKEIRLYKQAI